MLNFQYNYKTHVLTLTSVNCQLEMYNLAYTVHASPKSWLYECTVECCKPVIVLQQEAQLSIKNSATHYLCQLKSCKLLYSCSKKSTLPMAYV